MMMTLGDFSKRFMRETVNLKSRVCREFKEFREILWNVNRKLFPQKKLFGISVKGASHKKNGIPCQDAVFCIKKRGFVFAAVADGHGSADLSDTGSKVAVEVAFSVLEKSFKKLRKKLAQNRTMETALKDIEEKWRRTVKKHYLDNYMEEAGGTFDDAVYDRYGTTLLFCIVFGRTVIASQLGDGEIVFVKADGETYNPLPESSRSVANSTESICENGAAKNFRTYIKTYTMKEKNPFVILLSTDGYPNSFETKDDFLQVGGDMAQIIKTEGFSTIENNLEEWLNCSSTSGSGDDATCSVICLGGFELWNLK
jgi:serine/threonine protein phosphatase PrpC